MRFFLPFFLYFCLCPPAAGAQHASLLSEYSHRAWGAADGAPAQVQAITQTPDGWLWLSAPTGLYRFDGARFERMERVGGQALLSTIVLPLFSDAGGGLWVGYRFGGVSFFKDGAARHYGAEQGFPGGAAMSFARAPDGVMWATSVQGLAYLDATGARWVRVGAESGFDPQPSAVRQVLFDRAGTVWVSTGAGVYFRHRGETRFRLASPSTVELWSIAAAPDGTLWASDGNDANYRVAETAPRGRAKPRPALPGSGLWFDRAGTMWLLRAGSVERVLADAYPDARQRVTEQQGLSGDSPQTFFEDRDENIWIGTVKGLDRLRRYRLAPVDFEQPLNQAALAPDPGGGVWVSTNERGARRFDAAGRPTPALGPTFMAAAAGADGQPRMATRAGIWSPPATRQAPVGPPPELVKGGTDLRALALDRDGVWWAGILGHGIYLYQNGRWSPARARYPALPDERAMALYRDGRGRLWIAYAHNRLALVEGGKVTLFGAADGLQLGNVLSMYGMRAQFWVAGERGAAWFDGHRFVMLRGPGGLDFRGVTGIVESADGALWMHGYQGLFHLAAAPLAEFARRGGGAVAYELFDANDGLDGTTSPVGPIPSLVQAADGWLWVATTSAVRRLDPRHIRRNRRAPAVAINAVSANGRDYTAALGGGAALALPQGTTGLHLVFSALGLSLAQRVAFRYRLEGVDRDWQNADGRREAFYTNLGPGSYRFQVIAANEDGVWNNDGALLALRIAPAFEQTLTFKLLCLLALLALAYLVYRWRLRQMMVLLEARLRERLAERERIARTLHDTLLQGVQGALLFMQVAVKKVPPELAARARLERATLYLEEALSEGRDQVMGLRAAGGADAGLAELLARVGQRMAEHLPAAFSLQVRGAPYALELEAGDAVYAIGREAIVNAFRHAGARHIAVELVYQQDRFALLVSDDGKGVALEAVEQGVRSGHWGVLGMRERAAGIGATLAIGAGALERGTAVWLTLPRRGA